MLCDGKNQALIYVDALMIRGDVKDVESGPKMDTALTPSVFSASGDGGLPIKNEDYGTRQYWCVQTHPFLLPLNF